MKSICAIDSNISAVVVSIKQVNGPFMAEMKSITLYKFNNAYISKPLALDPGDYELNSFFLVNDNDTVLYVTPNRRIGTGLSDI